MINDYMNRNIQVSPRTTNRIASLISIVIGLTFLMAGLITSIVGIVAMTTTKHLKEVCTETATGTIVDYETKVSQHRERRGGSRSHSYRTVTRTTYPAIIEYEVDGRTYRITANTSSSVKPEIGKRETVHYNPDDPDEAYTGKGLGISSAVILGPGILFAGVGVFIMIFVPLSIKRAEKTRQEEIEIMSRGQVQQPQPGQPYQPYQSYQPYQQASRPFQRTRPGYDEDGNKIDKRYE